MAQFQRSGWESYQEVKDSFLSRAALKALRENIYYTFGAAFNPPDQYPAESPLLTTILTIFYIFWDLFCGKDTKTISFHGKKQAHVVKPGLTHKLCKVTPSLGFQPSRLNTFLQVVSP